MPLQEYQRKRDFKQTSEPAGPGKTAKGKGNLFVIQKHAATRLHYDLRLEAAGTLKSWALPKGMPYEHGEKRLAVMVEDHPLAYSEFEGTIPARQYGGGTVMIWDRGTYDAQSAVAVDKQLAKGKLHFTLDGTKLQGEWYLVRLRDAENQWLIIRGGESMKPPSAKLDNTSAASGCTMAAITRAEPAPEKVATKRHRPAKAKQQTTLPEFVPLMMARPATKPPTGEWSYEIKFDGWRAAALIGSGNAALFSRNENDLSHQFPEIIDALSALKTHDTILDGEIVVLDPDGRPSFQMLQALATGAERPPVFYYAFDLLRHGGKDLRARPIEERKKKLVAVLKNGKDPLRYSPGLGSDAAQLLERGAELGLEGLIGKRESSLYESGRRTGAWIKLKLQNAQEFVIGGYTNPQGTRAGFGALLVGYYEGKKLLYAGKVGTGFDDQLLRSLYARFKKSSRKTCPFDNLPQPAGGRWGGALTAKDMRDCHWIAPKLVCQVSFTEWTRDGRLRHPVFAGLRNDKDAADVVREVQT